MKMNKVLLAAGLLSAGIAFGQQTTGTSSTSTSTSSYNNSNTGNYNSQDATSGRNSSTDKPSSTTANSNRKGMDGKRRGNMNSSSPSSKSMNDGTSYNGDMNNMGTSTAGSTSGTPAVEGSAVGTGTGTYNTTTGTTATTGYNNSVGTSTAGSTSGYNSSSTGTTTGSAYDNTATGTSATQSANGSYNNNMNSAGGTSVTTTDVYSTQTRTSARPERTNDYKNFAYGIYVGLNTTKFKGEALDANGAATALTGRLGYQAGFFVRGGGRLYGQIGAEYFASSSNYFTAGSGQSVASINDQINIKYIQVPVYIGYKLTESDRGISAVRVQVGLEYANQIGSTANRFGNLNNLEIKSGTFNGLGQIGFDAGPVFLDLTYHYGFSNAIQQNAGFAGSQRRILSASLGFKF